jgi:hypothetical protein
LQKACDPPAPNPTAPELISGNSPAAFPKMEIAATWQGERRSKVKL